jgi:uncharacterized protein (UPF0264 family)
MQLLISVRNGEEARAALAGGADIIDAKEPAAGALGMVSLAAFRAIVRAVGGAVPVTAALEDAASRGVDERAGVFTAAGAAFVKIGFAGVPHERAASAIVAAVRGATSIAGAAVVAVAYADHDRVGAPSPDVVAGAAAAGGASGVLLDTAVKDGPALRHLLDLGQLQTWVRRVQRAGMFAAMAGQLRASDLMVIRDIGADIAGVRGAACEGGRNGRVTVPAVRSLTDLLGIRSYSDASRGVSGAAR